MKLWAAALALFVIGAGQARAADQPLYRPPPAWVKPIAIPKPKDDAAAGAVQMLLQDVQTRFSAEGDEFYEETAVKVLSAQGLAGSGNIILAWRPDTDTLIIHKILILRGDQTIDLLAGGKTMQVLRRETSLERAMLDGTLTAIMPPEGLQVGDVLDLAYTRQSRDPVLKGHSEEWATLLRPGVVSHAYVRTIWPRTKPVRWRATEGLPKAAAADTADGKELVLDLTDVEAPRPPRGAPQRFSYLAQLQLTDFASWAEVSALAQPLFAKAAALAPNSPLHAEIDRIKAASSDPKARAMVALKLVEDKIRYLFLGLNNGGYIPADADVTWTRRFGDCKAKTVLLLALLKELGVDAQPALVSATAGDGLDERLPSMTAFDHVAVLARIGGKTYWMDGTRSGDADLDALPMPNFHWMLPVQVAGGDLQKMLPTLYPDPMLETRMRLDASAGMDAPAPAHLEHIFRNDAGLAVQLKMQSLGRTDLDQLMRAYWRAAVPWIEPKQMLFSPDTGQGVVLSMDGAATVNWAQWDGGRVFYLDDSNFGAEVNLQREPGPNRDAPFAVTYPAYVQRSITVILPNKGQNFRLTNTDAIDQVVAGIQYKRTARIDAGVAKVEIIAKAISPEYPASEAPAVTITLRDWQLHPVGVVAKPVLTLKDYDEAIRRDPKNARLFFDRAEAYAAEKDLGHAIQDYTESIRLKPDFFYAWNERGRIHADKGEYDLAIKDYSEAIRLKPGDEVYLRNRGLSYEAKKDWGRAIADYDQAILSKPDYVAALNNRGFVHQTQGQLDLAVRDYDEALRLKPDFGPALSNRGWVKSAQGAYDAAIDDLTQAIRLNPNYGDFLGRGFAHQSKKDWARAIADYDQAIKLQPDSVDALNRRGFVHQANQQFDLAVRDYDEVLRLRPDFQQALTNRGKAHVALGQFDAALDDFNQLVRLSPRDPMAVLERGIAHESNHDMEHALQDFDEALRLRPGMVAVYASRGPARIQQGQVDAGFRDLDELVRVLPTDAHALNLRCWERAKLGKALDRALADCNAALRLAPAQAYILDSRGLVHLRREEYQSALADCDAAIQLAPKQTATYFVRGLVKRRLGRLTEGDADIALAKAAAPTIAETYAKMGVTP